MRSASFAGVAFDATMPASPGRRRSGGHALRIRRRRASTRHATREHRKHGKERRDRPRRVERRARALHRATGERRTGPAVAVCSKTSRPRCRAGSAMTASMRWPRASTSARCRAASTRPRMRPARCGRNGSAAARGCRTLIRAHATAAPARLSPTPRRSPEPARWPRTWPRSRWRPRGAHGLRWPSPTARNESPPESTGTPARI